MDLPLLLGSTAARYLPLAGWLGKPLDVAYSRCSPGGPAGVTPLQRVPCQTGSAPL